MAEARQAADIRPSSFDPSYWDNELGGWDRITIDGTVLPGLWTVEARAKRLIDIKKAAGKDGAHVKDKGYEPSEIRLNGRIQSYQQWQDFQDIFENFHPKKKGGARNPFDISHPLLALLAITQAYVVEVRPRHPEGGVFSVEIDLIEYFINPVDIAKKKIKIKQSVNPNAHAGVSGESFDNITPPSDDAISSGQSNTVGAFLASYP